MKKNLRCLSMFLTIVFMFSFVSMTASAYEEDWWEYDWPIHTPEFCFQEVKEEIFIESDEYAKYAYIVCDNEAAIINIHVDYRGDEKIDLVLPITLGGYPVTAIGYYDGRVDVTWFNHYNDESEKDSGLEYCPDYDLGLSYYVSRLVIPEGYKYIYDGALIGVYYVSFPKSLRKISGQPFEELYTHADENGEKYTVLPDCQYSYASNVPYIISTEFYRPIYFPSRLGSEWLLNDMYRGDLYIPSNYSPDTMRRIFFVTDSNEDTGTLEWTADMDKSYGRYTTIHCAPDSEFLQVFNEITWANYYTIITDVVPAEYIAFPSDTVNVHVGDVVDLEAKTYPTEAIWTACDYTVSDPSIVQIDDYSGRITALKEGTVTVTATHCERGFVDTCTVNVVPESSSGVQEIKPATDTPYYSYGNRDYKLELTGSPSKIQVVRSNGATTTIDRSKATITSNGDAETWVVNMRVEAGEHAIRAKYGKVWDEATLPFTVEYDTPKADTFSLTYENGMGTFEVVTDPQIAKIQFVLDNGATLTYSQSYSHIGEDGMRHWTVSRKLPAGTTYTLKTKLGNVWTLTDLTVKT